METERKKTDGSHRADVREWNGVNPTPVCCYTCDAYTEGYCHEHEDYPPEDFREEGCNAWIEGVPF